METLLNCKACPRLCGYLKEVRVRYADYHARPVVPFGDAKARLLIVGLAPGMHGANRTGRPFTGDYAGLLLYDTLHRFGFASAPVSMAIDDGLRLKDARITNAVKCLPPGNKPELSEIKTCNHFLARELSEAPAVRVIVALGSIAHKSVLMALGGRQKDYPFGHGLRHVLPGNGMDVPERVLIDSYHCSRYNTQTRRLTTEGFHDVFRLVRNELDA